MNAPAIVLAPSPDEEARAKYRERAEKEWAAWDAELDKQEKEGSERWAKANEEWLARLMAQSDRMDAMARYCKRLEETCRHLEARLRSAEDCIHASRCFDAMRHVYMPAKEELKNSGDTAA